MCADPSIAGPTSSGADRICVNCGKVVSADRKRFCNHCGLPFSTVTGEALPLQQPGSSGRLLLKSLATIAFVLPVVGPLSSLPTDQGTLLAFWSVAVAGTVAVVFAWLRPLPGGILLAVVGTVSFIAGLIMDATTDIEPTQLYWTFWFFPGGLIGGALFLAAAFWRAPAALEAGEKVEGAAVRTRLGFLDRVRREAIGTALLVVVGLVFAAVLASYAEGLGSDQPVPRAIFLVGFPLLLVGAGVLGYREDRARGSFIAGLVAAVVALGGIEVAQRIVGQTLFKVGEAEWIGEAFLVVGLMIVGGGFFGLFGGGIASLIDGLPRRHAHP
jgi:hypothetical protein